MSNVDIESQDGSSSSHSDSSSCHHDEAFKAIEAAPLQEEPSLRQKRPAPVQWWIKYGVPGRMALDVLLWLCNPQFWNAATDRGTSPFLIRNTLNTVLAAPEHQLLNKDHLLTVCMVIVSVVLPNIIESALLAGYHLKMTHRWPQLLVHHILLLGWVVLVLVAGKGIVASQAIISLTHLFYLPLALFPKWRRWLSSWRVALLASVVIGGYLLSSGIHLTALMLLWTSPTNRGNMGNSQYGYYVIGPYLVFFNFEIITSVLAGLWQRRKEGQERQVDYGNGGERKEPEPTTEDDCEIQSEETTLDWDA